MEFRGIHPQPLPGYCIILWIYHGWIYIPSLVGYFVPGDWDMMKKICNDLSIIGILNMGVIATNGVQFTLCLANVEAFAA